jgi:hypothetical protein
MQPTPIAEPLDDYLRAVVSTLHSAVHQGLLRAADGAADRQIQDCQDILSVIMAGQVQYWLD